MPFTPLDGTGFETGSEEQIASVDRNRAYVTADAHTGAYGLHLDTNYPSLYGWARWSVTGTPSDLYISGWVKPDGDYYCDFSVYVDSGHWVGLRHDGNYWDAYVNGAKVADGSVLHTKLTWHRVSMHIVIDNSGTIDTKIDGVDDISYSGDTQPGATTAIEYVRVYQYATGVNKNADSYVDDIVFGTGDWPGDIRFATALVPDTDTVQADWTPSTGSDNYDMVDDVPENDAEYVSAGSVGDKDLYGLSDWAASGSEEPRFIIDWVRAKKDTADSCDIKSLVKSSSTENSGGSLSLSTDWAYYGRLLDVDPDTSAEWTEAGINALEVGQNRL